jgi:hypothetical protein
MRVGRLLAAAMMFEIWVGDLVPCLQTSFCMHLDMPLIYFH